MPPSPTSHPSLRTYASWGGVCLAAALVSLFRLSVPRELHEPGTLLVGQTFTALTLLAGALLWYRRFRSQDRVPLGSWPLFVAACLLPLALGWAYASLGGALSHARTFVLLPPLMFVAFAPRPAPSEDTP